MRTIIVAAVLAALSASGAIAQQRASPDAAAFAKKAAAANTFEIQSSKLAAERSRSAEVKSFARQMIADHGKAGREFKVAVKAAGISPPPPERPDPRQKAILSNLRKTLGTMFDQAYVDAQLQAHEEAVALFQRYAQNGRNQPLKAFAQTTLPTLEEHLDMVQRLSSEPGVVGRRQLSPPAAYRPSKARR
jgi:putative membrane protein